MPFSYTNPIIHADYSDPDAIRVGDTWYMISSSFTYFPAIPVLESKDLVHWKLVNHVLKDIPDSRYDIPRQGSGAWAPSIRYHEGMFYVFIPMVDERILVARSRDIYGNFEINELPSRKGWIDPCPLFDGDRTYMVFAYAKSRCGINSILSVVELDKDLTHFVSKERTVYDGRIDNPVIEGPKFYKIDGWYHIMAPAGGVVDGWQVDLRSRNVYGPYEARTVMRQADTNVNGPHQGALVDTPDGRNYFLHFQDKGPYGRIIHLQRVEWKDSWPVIGKDDGSKVGKPESSGWIDLEERRDYAIAESDDFSTGTLGLQWQWQARERKDCYFFEADPCRLVLRAGRRQDGDVTLWNAANALTQIPQHESFLFEAEVSLVDASEGDFIAIGTIGKLYSYLALEKTKDGYGLVIKTGTVVDRDSAREMVELEVPHPFDHARLAFFVGKDRRLSYFLDGTPIGTSYPFERGDWTGAKLALWAFGKEESGGLAKIGYVRIKDADK